MERRTVQKELDEIEACNYEEHAEYIDVDSLLVQLQVAKNKYEGKLMIKISTCDSWACNPSPVLILEHIETDEEYGNRIKKEESERKQRKEYRKKQYEELRKEFG